MKLRQAVDCFTLIRRRRALLAAALLPVSSTQKVEAMRSSETSADSYRTLRYYNPEELYVFDVIIAVKTSCLTLSLRAGCDYVKIGGHNVRVSHCCCHVFDR
jgi:hypothetical protein